MKLPGKKRIARYSIWAFLLLALLTACNTLVRDTPMAEEAGIAEASADIVVFRINAGASNAVTINGVQWQADRFFQAGQSQAYSTSATISGTDSQQLYRTGRRSSKDGRAFWYDFPVEQGSYSVRFHFVETEYQAIGARVFDVDVNGVNQLKNLDIFKEVGKRNQALVKEREVTVTGNSLRIDFKPAKARAVISAIEVLRKPAPPPSSPQLPLLGKSDFQLNSLSGHSRKWYDRLWRAIKRDSPVMREINEIASEGRLERMGRVVNTYLTALLTDLRVTGDLALLDEVDRVMQLARGALADLDGDGYVNWRWQREGEENHKHYNTDWTVLDEQLTHGFVAMVAYAFRVNAHLDPRYKERADFWTDYLKNHFEAKWRERNKISSGFPFLVARMTHAYANWIRYHYYMHLLTGEPSYLNEATRMAGVLNKQMIEVNGGTAFVWDHFATQEPHNSGTQFASSGNCQSFTYARYTVHSMIDLANEGFSVFTNAFMQKVAGTLRDIIMDNEDINFAPDVCGGKPMGGLQPSNDDRETLAKYASSPYTTLAAWDALAAWDRSGKIVSISEKVYNKTENNVEEPRRIHIPASMVFVYLK
jgi:hypothetical protein